MQNRYISLSLIEQLYFSGCSGCQNSCCDGSRFLFSPLILHDFEEVYSYFPIVFTPIQGEWRALIIIAGEDSACHYHQEGHCTIYEHRPPGCRLYPINPYYDDILIDTSCHAIGTEPGIFLASKKEINSSFYHKRLDNFDIKRCQSEDYLKRLENGFEPMGEIGEMIVYRYSGEEDDPYIRMHRESLELLSANRMKLSINISTSIQYEFDNV
jgi:uncharacterized protein